MRRRVPHGYREPGAARRIATADISAAAVPKNNAVVGSVNANKIHWVQGRLSPGSKKNPQHDGAGVTGPLPSGKKAGVALADGSISDMPYTDVNGSTALAMSAAEGVMQWRGA